VCTKGTPRSDEPANLAEALGPEAALSKSTVSRVCQAIKDDYDAWAERSLGQLDLDYLFLDGSHFKYHQLLPPTPLRKPPNKDDVAETVTAVA